MTVIHIPDMDTLDIEAELSMLADYRELLEEHLEHAVSKEEVVRNERLAQASKAETEEDYWIESQMAHQDADWAIEKYRRLFRGPFIIALWAFFESSVQTLAELIRVQRKAQLRFADFSGSVLQKAWKYYPHVLGFPVGDDGTKSRLSELYELRCALAHSNGYLSLMEENDRARLKKLIKHRPGLELAVDRVLMTKEFLEREHELVERVVDDLLMRYKQLKKTAS